MKEKKYIFVDGVMKLNPDFKDTQTNQNQPTTIANPNEALAIVSTPQDIMQASEAYQQKTGNELQVPTSTTESTMKIQDPNFLAKFQAPQELEGGDVLDGLTKIFAKYEVPIGLVNKLLQLSEYKLNFIVDDSGSMGLDSDVPMNQASQYIKQKVHPQRLSGKMARWEEAEDRIHVMIDMLAYIPTDLITIHFLNRNDKIVLDHKGKTPEQFAQQAHQQISQVFHPNRIPSGGTPVFRRLYEDLNQSLGCTMHYLFTDGMPSDVPFSSQQPNDSLYALKQLILNRKNPRMNPLTFMSCTDQDEEAQWMKDLEGIASFTAELDDFASERREVLEKQGPALPFSKGFWLIRQLVDAICPDDLDAMDEEKPFTKKTLDDLMGRKLTKEEYLQYFNHHPQRNKYYPYLNQFAREDILAKDIVIQNSNQNAYPNPYYNQNLQNTNQDPFYNQPQYNNQNPYNQNLPYNNQTSSNNNQNQFYNNNTSYYNSNASSQFWNKPQNQATDHSGPKPTYIPPQQKRF